MKAINGAFAAGMTACVSGLAMRLAFAHSGRGVALAIGGAGLEAAVFLYLKPKAAALEGKTDEVMAKREIIHRAKALLASSNADVARRKAGIAGIEDEIAAIEERKLKDRVFAPTSEQARKLAEGAARLGIAQQIQINRVQNVVPEVK